MVIGTYYLATFRLTNEFRTDQMDITQTMIQKVAKLVTPIVVVAQTAHNTTALHAVMAISIMRIAV